MLMKFTTDHPDHPAEYHFCRTAAEALLIINTLEMRWLSNWTARPISQGELQ